MCDAGRCKAKETSHEGVRVSTFDVYPLSHQAYGLYNYLSVEANVLSIRLLSTPLQKGVL